MCIQQTDRHQKVLLFCCTFFIGRNKFFSVTVCGCETWSVTLRQEYRWWMSAICRLERRKLCGELQGAVAHRSLRPPQFSSFWITYNDAPKSLRLLWTSDQPVAERDLYPTTQHSQQTNIQALGGIRTHNISRRAAVDLRLRTRGHWDR